MNRDVSVIKLYYESWGYEQGEFISRFGDRGVLALLRRPEDSRAVQLESVNIRLEKDERVG